MADAITVGQVLRFLRRNGFTAEGKKQHLYIGLMDGQKRVVTVHYHKDRDNIPIGTLHAIASQLGLKIEDFIDRVKSRS